MQVNANTEDVEFGPIKLEITLETQAEAEFLYSVLNHCAVADAASEGINLSTIRNAMNVVNQGPSKFNYLRVFDLFGERLRKHPSLKIEKKNHPW